ncbi:MAG: hypothetical protein M1839_004606 [Geoglossum umbratile]|nr:MAG: hypothetical protein M1839_004606 [Geoglossum umbratile]
MAEAKSPKLGSFDAPNSPATPIDTDDELPDVEKYPESYYKNPNQNFSLGQASEEATRALAGFKIVDEVWNPDTGVYEATELSKIDDGGVEYLFVVHRQICQLKVDYRVDIKSRELQGIVYWALGGAAPSTTVELSVLLGVLPVLRGHLNNLVGFLEQLKQIGMRTPIPSPNLSAENSNSVDLSADLSGFPFLTIQGGAGNEMEN